MPWAACCLRRFCLEVLWLLFFLSRASTGTMASKALIVLESYVFKQGPIHLNRTFQFSSFRLCAAVSGRFLFFFSPLYSFAQLARRRGTMIRAAEPLYILLGRFYVDLPPFFRSPISVLLRLTRVTHHASSRATHST